MFLNGRLKTAFSATSALMSARTPAIRPVLLNDEEVKAALQGTTKPAVGAKDLHFRMMVSPMDCQGCGNCVDACPAKEKALVMMPFATQNI